MNQLSERMSLARSTMTRVVDTLVRDGILERVRDREDRRLVEVQLTEKGKDLIPIEFVHVLLPTLLSALILFFVGGLKASVAAVSANLAGVVLFPILLPWLPIRDFSTKGFILGGLVALLFALESFLGKPDVVWWLRAGWALCYLLAMPPVTAYLALNFTGSTTFTSRSGVRREIFKYIPLMAGMFGTGIALILVLTVIRLMEG